MMGSWWLGDHLDSIHIPAWYLVVVAVVGILHLLWLCLCLGGGSTAPAPTEQKKGPKGYVLNGLAPRTASRTGDKAHSEGDACLWSRGLSTVVTVRVLRLARHLSPGSCPVPAPRQRAGMAPWQEPAPLAAFCSYA